MHDHHLHLHPSALPLFASSGVLGFVVGERTAAAVIAVALAVVTHYLLPVARELTLRALAPSADLIAERVRRFLTRGVQLPAGRPETSSDVPPRP